MDSARGRPGMGCARRLLAYCFRSTLAHRRPLVGGSGLGSCQLGVSPHRVVAIRNLTIACRVTVVLARKRPRATFSCRTPGLKSLELLPKCSHLLKCEP